MKNAEVQSRSHHSISRSRNVDPSLRASALFALRVYNSHILEGLLDDHIHAVMHARCDQQVRDAIARADRLLRR